MKKVLLLMFCALMGFALNAQVSENFSDYTVGGKLAQQAQAMGRTYWTTWSEAPGSDEDGTIAEIGGNKCLNILYTGTTGNDQVLKLGDKNSGQWELTFKFNVPAGKDGYFNLKSVFPSADSPTWAVQVYLGTDEGTPGPSTPGQGVVYAGASTGFPFTFTHDTWVPVRIYVNLDDDDASIFINDNLVRNWQYSTGSFGQSNHPYIAAFNAFAPNAASTSSYYIDDIVFQDANSEILYETSFDDVPNNSYVAQSYPQWWRTWSDLPGTAEDALITNEQSSTSPQSAKLSWGTDLIFKAGGKTTDAYNIDFKMYIPNNGIAYFNLLQTFTGDQNSKWAVGAYFNVSGTEFPGNGTYVHQDGMMHPFTFPYDTWFTVSMYVNLDADIATININGTQVLEWQYSIQESGGIGEKILEMADFFPPQAGSVFYIDDFSYTKAGDPPPPPTISVMPDEIEFELQPDATKFDYLYIISEEEGTLRARWSTYIDYAPLATGGTTAFELAIGDPLTAPAGGIGYSEAFEREIAIRLAPADYVDKLGGELKQVAFFIQTDTPASDVTFRVYGQGSAENLPGAVLATKVLPMASFIINDWNWVDIDPVQLTGGEYWVTVAMTQAAGSYPLTTLSGPAQYGGNWIKTGDGGWGRLGEDLNYNWAIQTKGTGTLQKVWGLLDQTYGTTQPASQSDIKVTVNSTGFEEDIYTANIVVLTNDENHLRFDIPLTMDVNTHVPSNDTSIDEVTVDGIVAPPDTPGSQYDFRVQIEIEPDQDVVDIVVTPHHELATVSGQIEEQPVKAGQNVYTFTVTAEDGTEQEYKLLVYATIKTAISEIDNSIKLFPNPVSDYLYITSDYTVETITIYDLTGKMVKQVKQPGTSVNLSDLSAGYYLLKVTTEQGDAMHKFVKD